ncbi:hydantoin racemase [Alsobacter metallidurans]|uniref:Hydantoin racemase n=1 Tax=Alsobacter metallidurans TaxID=340221 RepID=A0A917MHS2_9HYPH|nr:aspartate/glutamate racemase family protein [Alsobacter metallidurans]GGH18587.1 hydantoin racemase [Alsobacter metallidurans]
MRILLVNPNTNAATTAAMVAIAGEAAGGRATVTGITAPSGPPLITQEDALAAAALTVAGMADEIAALAPDAVIVSAFGDPGLAGLRRALSMPVVGIGEAAFRAAPAGYPVAVVTTTPDLVTSISAMGRTYRGDSFLGVFLPPGDPVTLMADASALRDALHGACCDAVQAGARAIIIGGGPLASAARSLRNVIPARLVEPIPEAVRLAISVSAS